MSKNSKKLFYTRKMLESLYGIRLSFNLPEDQLVAEYQSAVEQYKNSSQSLDDPNAAKLFLIAEAYHSYLVEIAPKRSKYRVKKSIAMERN